MRRAKNLFIFICRMSRNRGSLKLLEPEGPVEVCIGIALPSSNPTGDRTVRAWVDLPQANIFSILLSSFKGKVKQSRYKPGVVQRVPGS